MFRDGEETECDLDMLWVVVGVVLRGSFGVWVGRSLSRRDERAEKERRGRKGKKREKKRWE